MITVNPVADPEPGPPMRPPEAPASSQEAALAALMTLARTVDDTGEAQPFRARRRRALPRPPLPLLAILAVQAALSLRLVWSNTAFTDEGLYIWAGHLELGRLLYGTPIPPFQTYFSGAPVVYPPLAAIADSYGGLALVRLVSLAFMLGATVLLYGTAGRLFSRKTAVLATALFVTVGPAQDLGAFATFDAMAVFLLALAAWLTVRAAGRLSEPLLITAGLALALADAAKYATGLWNPVIFALAVISATRGGWLRTIARGARLAGYTGVPLVIATLGFGGHAYVQGITNTTLAPASSLVSATSPATSVLWTAATYIGILLGLAIAGTAAAWRCGARTRLLCLTLTIAAVLAPIDEARLHLLTALYKHVVFGGWFAAIMAGYALARATDVNKAKGWRIGVATAAFLSVIGYNQATGMFGYWPPSSPLMTAMTRALSGTSGPVLADNSDSYIIRYVFYRDGLANNVVSDDARISSLGVSSGSLASEIRSNDFAVIEADVSAAAGQPDAALLAALRNAGGYRLYARIPWHDYYTHGFFEIWRYAPAGPR